MSGTHGTPAERLSRGLERKPSGCLEWTGGTNDKGYGKIGVEDKKTVYVHRLAWAITNGPIPSGLKVLHHCDNPPCCEAEGDDHLFLGTQAENLADMTAKGRRGTNGSEKKTHCPQGHPYDEANTYINKQGKRECRACHSKDGRLAAKERRRAGLVVVRKVAFS